MKLLTCPLNGLRPISEFVYGGPVRSTPAATCTDGEWTDYVFNRDGAPGVKREWWCHIASGYWFIVTRDTARDLVLATSTVEAAQAEASF